MGLVIAALFVATDGIYFGRKDVDPWDLPRDARSYGGPLPVAYADACEKDAPELARDLRGLAE